MAIVKNLEQLQKVFGWNQETMAGELGISQAMLSMLYSGKEKVGLEMLQRVVRRFPELEEQAEEEVKRLLKEEPERDKQNDD